VSPDSLKQDLLNIEGVEGAEIDGPGVTPAGLRIRIAQGADQSGVGSAIRRVLTKHGFGTDTRLPGEDTDPRPFSVPGEAVEELVASEATREVTEAAVEDELDATSTVMVMADVPDSDEGSVDDVIDLTGALADEKVDVVDPLAETAVQGDVPAVEASPLPGSWRSASLRREDTAPPLKAIEEAAGSVIARIDRVAIQEARDGIVVTVSSTDGHSESQPASATEGGVESAIVKAAARLAKPGVPDPTIVEIEDRRVEGVDIVMIVLSIDGAVAAGAAIVGAGRSFALGRATWAALSL